MTRYRILLTTSNGPGDAKHELLIVESAHRLYHPPAEQRGRAQAGRWHPGHNDTRMGEEVPLARPRFAYGGVWYDDEAAWLAAWSGAVIERVPCTLLGEPLPGAGFYVHRAPGAPGAPSWRR